MPMNPPNEFDAERMALMIREKLKRIHEIQSGEMSEIKPFIPEYIYKALKKKLVSSSFEIYALAYELMKSEASPDIADKIFLPKESGN